MSYKRILHVVFLVALTGMVFIYPFEGYFRFTLSVAMLATLLLYFPDISVVLTSTFSGIMIFLLRTIFVYWLGSQEFWTIFDQNLPTVLYYLIFGVLFKTLKIRSYIGNATVLILLLTIIDIASNIFELLARDISARNEAVFGSIVGVALCRALVAVYGYYALKKYYTSVVEQDRLHRYAEMTVLIAKLKSELFYLKKSSQDIEQVMEKGYVLYQGLHAMAMDYRVLDTYAEEALNIAREIHEVKKDYYRVSAGIENVLKPPTNIDGLKFSEIFFIIEENTKRCLQEVAQNIDISFSYTQDFTTKRQYVIVAILDNLITNAIDACNTNGYIHVSQSVVNDKLILKVADSGCGIGTDEYEIIFAPGYSTKYCRHTGKMSTGLGLSQVRTLTESLGGLVRVTSQKGRGAIFAVTIPLSNL